MTASANYVDVCLWRVSYALGLAAPVRLPVLAREYEVEVAIDVMVDLDDDEVETLKHVVLTKKVTPLTSPAPAETPSHAAAREPSWSQLTVAACGLVAIASATAAFLLR